MIHPNQRFIASAEQFQASMIRNKLKFQQSRDVLERCSTNLKNYTLQSQGFKNNCGDYTNRDEPEEVEANSRINYQLGKTETDYRGKGKITSITNNHNLTSLIEDEQQQQQPENTTNRKTWLNHKQNLDNKLSRRRRTNKVPITLALDTMLAY